MTDPRETDLFGNPVRVRKGMRGRPPKELTEKDLDALEAGLVRGWSRQRIADALDIGLSTLKRNFGPILSGAATAPDRLKLAIYAATVRKALGGDMGAVRQLRQMITEDERADMERRLDENPQPEKVGKKQMLRQDAEDAEAALAEELALEMRTIARH